MWPMGLLFIAPFEFDIMMKNDFSYLHNSFDLI